MGRTIWMRLQRRHLISMPAAVLLAMRLPHSQRMSQLSDADTGAESRFTRLSSRDRKGFCIAWNDHWIGLDRLTCMEIALGVTWGANARIQTRPANPILSLLTARVCLAKVPILRPQMFSLPLHGSPPRPARQTDERSGRQIQRNVGHE